MSKTAFITGISGQVGSYLAEHLIEKGYTVYGLVRKTSSTENIRRILDRVSLPLGDLRDQDSLNHALDDVKPDEVYHLAADQIVSASWDRPVEMADVTGLGTTRLLQAVHRYCPDAKVYHQSSSEIFGMVDCPSQNENTRFNPINPYAIAKCYAHQIAVNYRESYGMFICCGISFSMESPRRRIEFVTRKISDGVARIYLGKAKRLVLGNLESIRDWGFAGDYVRAMPLILQQSEPDDYIIARGEPHSVKDFVELAFKVVGLDLRNYVEVDVSLQRPVDVNYLCGDATKLKQKLGWNPEVSFEELVRMMVKADLERVKHGG